MSVGADPSARGQKAALRARIEAWRRQVTPTEVRDWSRALTEWLMAWPPLLRSGVLMGYQALAREPQTAELLERAAAAGLAIALPLVVGPAISPRLWAPDRPRLPLAAAPEIDPARIGVVLVPGLAFDAAGGRLGRGGGHYDRFLIRLVPDALRVGCCFEGQIVPAVPREPWDQAVGAVATERGIREGGGDHGPGAETAARPGGRDDLG